jgi:hypothetical protein
LEDVCNSMNLRDRGSLRFNSKGTGSTHEQNEYGSR